MSSLTSVLTATLTMLVLGALMGIILYVASKAFYVEEDPRIETTTSMLPGYNCGGCGYPGCSGLAGALVNKETDTVNCKPCKPEQRAKIVEYLNTTEVNGETLKVKAI